MATPDAALAVDLTDDRVLTKAMEAIGGPARFHGIAEFSAALAAELRRRALGGGAAPPGYAPMTPCRYSNDRGYCYAHQSGTGSVCMAALGRLLEKTARYRGADYIPDEAKVALADILSDLEDILS